MLKHVYEGRSLPIVVPRPPPPLDFFVWFCWAVWGLCCCMVYSLAVVRGLLIAVASLVVEHGL